MNGGAPKPCHPRQASVPGRDTPPSPFRGGLSGNGMLPVFLQHLPPPVGACGERNYALFFGIFFEEKNNVEIPDIASKNSHWAIFSSKTVTTRQIWRRTTVPQKLATFQSKRALHQPPSDPTEPETTLRSSLLAARDQTGPNRGIPGLLTGRSKARCWWPGSSPYRDA